MKFLLLSLSLVGFVFHAPASVADFSAAAAEIKEFHQVSEGIFRGAHPSAAALDELAKLGIKTVINLENDESDVSLEGREAELSGLRMISSPMSKIWAPRDSQVDLVLALLADPRNRPLFIHCTLGQDRTGLIIGLYRVLQEGKSPADAYSEMLDSGFKEDLMIPMDRYFRARTGLSSSENENSRSRHD